MLIKQNEAMIKPQYGVLKHVSGGPPNSMTFQRDYRQQYHDNMNQTRGRNNHSKL